ncbi:MAG: hypothetical protein KF878_37950, partial [Planctomycetes bacterium]|nr:hypothetical protein [Planctomycetota bacterium]
AAATVARDALPAPEPPAPGTRGGMQAMLLGPHAMLGGELLRASEAIVDALVARGAHEDALPLIEAAQQELGRTRSPGARRTQLRLLERAAASLRALGREPEAVEAERLVEEARRAWTPEGERRGGGGPDGGDRRTGGRRPRG